MSWDVGAPSLVDRARVASHGILVVSSSSSSSGSRSRRSRVLAIARRSIYLFGDHKRA
jgi:hypothetical protein